MSGKKDLLDFVEAQHLALVQKLSECFERSPAAAEMRDSGSPTITSTMTSQPMATGDDSHPDLPDLHLESEMGTSSVANSVVSATRRISQSGIEIALSAGHSPRHLSGSVSPSVLLGTEEKTASAFSRIEPYLEYVTVILVLLNALVLTLEYQVEGEKIGTALLQGIEPFSIVSNPSAIFILLDLLFDATFVLEWAICLCLLRKRFCLSMELITNTVLAMLGMVELVLILIQFNGGQISLSAFHVIHALSCLRILRCFRVLRHFRGPKLLLMACNSFLHSLFWAMVFLSLFMSSSALFLGNLLLDYFAYKQSLADRLWVWERYGTSLRCLYSLYEITFSGSWPSLTRPAIEKVHSALVIFFLLYITVVAFGVIRVITAVFLKDCLDAAANDAEHLVAERLVKKEEYARRLEAIFGAIDSAGQGEVTEDRLVEALERPVVRAYFQTSLDLDVHESKALFHILDDGDGTVTLEEFIDGMLRCKGNARAIDQVATQREVKNLDKKISRLMTMMIDNFQTSE